METIISKERLRDPDFIRDHLVMHVVGAEKEKEKLEGFPVIQVEDLLLVFRIALPIMESHTMYLTLNADMLKELGWTTEQLYEEARCCAPINAPAILKPMQTMLMDMCAPSEREEWKNLFETGSSANVDRGPELYVGTVEEGGRGAACIFYPEFMKEAARKLGGFYILPSSIHEVILVRDTADVKPLDLRRMVREINATVVSREDVLTDSVYHYSLKTKVFRRCLES
ncbi:MAG: hypothetical protein HUJ69_03825 [Lachnospiraceae bacterium]|nr:hypothetical protein [Lachnospiraceae bacterium]